MILDHLEGKKTIGVMAGDYVSKFICFDVDIHNKQQAKHVTYRIVDTLINIGIPDECIYISTSGNKGYHVDIYFDNVILNDKVKLLYELVINEGVLYDIDSGQVELRPTNQGLKLPLGINFKNKDSGSNRCWYVDYDKGLQPIKDYEYISEIKQIKKELVLDILCRHYDQIDIQDIDTEEAQKIEETKDYINEKYKPLDIYKKSIDKTYTIEYLEKLEREGLQQIGTRHNSLFNLSRYYKYLGLNAQENESQLRLWMHEQDLRTYATPMDDCYKDISRIVEYIYDNDIGLTVNKKEIVITYNEMLQIMSLKNKNQKLVTYAMLIHSKRFSDKKNIFYMSFPQLSTATNLSLRTVKDIVPKLEGKALEYIERNQIVVKSNKFITKKPNKYKMLITTDGDEHKQFKVSNSLVNFKDSYSECVLAFFELKELKELCPERQYYEFKGLYDSVSI
nr:hypothetical protein [Priestia flexa]